MYSPASKAVKMQMTMLSFLFNVSSVPQTSTFIFKNVHEEEDVSK
jgi:hypothetical protein